MSYGSLCEQGLLALTNNYPNGFQDHVIAIDVGKKKPIHAVRVETDDHVYLVKIDPAKVEHVGKPTIDVQYANKKEKKDA